MPTKFCPDCRCELPLSAFTHNRRSRDGLAFYCRQCASARHVASRRRRQGPPKRRYPPPGTVVPKAHKWCPECGGVKALDEFPRNRSSPSGYTSYCKPCHNRITRLDKDKHGGARNYHLRRRYGITVEHFERMFAEQNGVCWICRDAPAAHVDHDHATNRVRGLLCFNCNGALGQFRDRADLMLRAIAYLHAHRQAQVDEPELRFAGHLGLLVDLPRPH